MGVRTRGYSDEDRKAGRSGQSGGGPYPPEGDWPATVQDAYQDKVGKDDHPVWKLVFNVDGPSKTVERKYTLFLDNESQLANLVEALGQRNDPEEIEADDVIARRCRVVIKHEESWKKDGKIYANVSFLLPAASGGAPTEEKRRDARGGSRDRTRDHGATTHGGGGSRERSY